MGAFSDTTPFTSACLSVVHIISSSFILRPGEDALSWQYIIYELHHHLVARTRPREFSRCGSDGVVNR